MDNGPEFISHALEDWAKEMGVTLYFIDPGSPYLAAVVLKSWVKAA